MHALVSHAARHLSTDDRVTGLPVSNSSTKLTPVRFTFASAQMKPLLYASLAAYVVAAVHSILAFVNKRRGADRVTTYSLIIGFAAHTAAIITDWVQTGHYPLFSLQETGTFLSWTLVIAYGLAVYRYRIRALGIFLLPDSLRARFRLERGAGQRGHQRQPHH